jgi:hypothetical protein
MKTSGSQPSISAPIRVRWVIAPPPPTSGQSPDSWRLSITACCLQCSARHELSAAAGHRDGATRAHARNPSGGWSVPSMMDCPQIKGAKPTVSPPGWVGAADTQAAGPDASSDGHWDRPSGRASQSASAQSHPAGRGGNEPLSDETTLSTACARSMIRIKRDWPCKDERTSPGSLNVAAMRRPRREASDLRARDEIEEQEQLDKRQSDSRR